MLENLTALHRVAILLWTEHLLTSLQNLTREELISYISGEVSEVISPKGHLAVHSHIIYQSGYVSLVCF